MTKATDSLIRGLNKVQRERKAGRYPEALKAVDRLLEEWPDNPPLLIQRAELIQLQDNASAPGLDEARAALQRAVALDDQSPAAQIELGHFLSAVDDDPESAAACFDRAIRLCKHYLKESLLAQAGALSELGRRSEAAACLAEAHWLEPRSGRSSTGAVGDEILERLEGLHRTE